MFRSTVGRGISFLVAVAVVAACSSAAPGASTGGVASGAQATLAPARTAAPTAAPLQTAAPVGGSGPCDWVTETEMVAIVGHDAKPDRAKADAKKCDWKSSDFAVFINLHVDDVATLTAARLAYRDGKDVALGDEAFWAPGAFGLYVRKGNRVLAVQVVFLPSGLQRLDVATAVAAAALPRF